jgi:hypothetical protein
MISLLAAITILWTFECGVRDTLQGFSGTDWVNIQGPYQLEGTDYRVPVLNTAPYTLFRVHRDWGTPWVPDEVLASHCSVYDRTN